jgi:uncharacterized membrane protein YkvA (DUF1232 family)
MQEAIESKPIEIELNPREQRFYDRLRASVVEWRPNATSGLRDVLLLLPDLIVLLIRLTRDSRVPWGAKILAGVGVAYVLSPIDLLPEALLGPVGLIDDLLIVSAVLSKLLESVHPDLIRSHWSGHGDALDAISRLARWTETHVTQRFKSLFGRLTSGPRS